VLVLDNSGPLHWLRVRCQFTMLALMLNGRKFEGGIARALAYGASEDVVKPFRATELIACIRRSSDSTKCRKYGSNRWVIDSFFMRA